MSRINNNNISNNRCQYIAAAAAATVVVVVAVAVAVAALVALVAVALPRLNRSNDLI